MRRIRITRECLTILPNPNRFVNTFFNFFLACCQLSRVFSRGFGLFANIIHFYPIPAFLLYNKINIYYKKTLYYVAFALDLKG